VLAADDDEAPINSVIMKSADEVADALNVHAATVRRLAAAGQLPALKVGSQWRFDMNAVTAALEANAMQSSAVREHNAKVRQRAREYADNTIGFELPNMPGSFVVVCHPKSSRDILEEPERLLREFGLVDPSKLMKMSDSWAAIPDDPGIDREIAVAEAELAALREQKAARERIEAGIVASAEARVDQLESERAAESKGARAKT